MTRSMSVIATAMLALGLGWTLAAQTPTAQSPASTRLALVGGMLLDGYDAPPIHHAAILIDGDRIVRAGPMREVTIPAGTRVIDTSGRTMMPGMIELHAHLVLLGHGDYGRWFPWIDTQGRARMLPQVMEIAAKQLLMAGITSAVDLGRAAGREPCGEKPHRGRRNSRATDVDERSVADAQRRHLPRGLSDQGDQPGAGGGRNRAAGDGRRRCHQGARRTDARGLQGDCRCRARPEPARARARVCRDRRAERARDRHRRAVARGLRGHGAALQPAAGHRHRQRRPPRGHYRRASQLGLSRHRGVSRAAAGPAVEAGLSADALRRGAAVAAELARAALLLADRSRGVLPRTRD